MKRRGFLIAAAALPALAVLPGEASAGRDRAERHLRVSLNRARRARGVGKVRRMRELDRLAERHAHRMARAGELSHSDLGLVGERVPSVVAVGEVVAFGGDWRAAHGALLASTAHRRIMLHAGHDRVGIGAVRRDGRLWVVEILASV